MTLLPFIYHLYGHGYDNNCSISSNCDTFITPFGHTSYRQALNSSRYFTKNKAMIVIQGLYNPSGKLRAKDENSRWE